MADAQTFESYRPLLFSIAYRMLGSVMEAEDMVQETYLRYSSVPADSIQSPKAFLSAVVTRLCIDHLKSAKTQREQYVGTWLPEPLLTADAPAALIGERETISMAFLVLLESLSPVERAVFLLREVFDYPYGEIARIVGKSETTCRQHYRRAKQYVLARRPRFETSPESQQRLVQSFMGAVGAGDVESLAQVLAQDVAIYSDGGGKVPSAPRPIIGQQAVIRLLFGAARLLPEDARVDLAEVNGAPALLFWFGQRLHTVVTFTFQESRIHELHFIFNPDKLRHIHP